MGEGRTNDPRRRLTVAQAAAHLGISMEAMRARVKRDSVKTEREGGRVYVLLDSAQDTAQDTAQGAPEAGESNALIFQLREEVAYLRDENRRKDHIIAGLVERIPPAIEAPQEATESPETVEEAPDRAEPHSATGGPQEPVWRRWQRRWFGS